MKQLILAGLLAGFALNASAANHALLVAATSYPNKQQALVGPRNDARLMRTVLLQRGFAADKIQMLADGVPEAGMPTRAAILAALDDLAKRVDAGDFVYLHFAGHGSQQPVRNLAGNFEPDGRDEIFLPIDIGLWDGQTGAVKNAITDDELGERITAIRNRRAFVWAVFDTCHSGTITRGAPTEERSRQIAPAALGIPDALLHAARPPQVEVASTTSKLADDAGGLVAFYAAQSDETAPEMDLPRKSEHAQSHGLFTYTLAEALAQDTAMSYRQLGQFVLARYAALGRYAPTPLFEGTAMNSAVLGDQAGNNQAQWPITQKKGVLYLNAGLLHQLAPGSLLAVVSSPIAKTEDALGYLQISRADATTSQATPVAEPGKASIKPEDIQTGMYARLTQPAVDLSLRVARPEAGSGKPDDLVSAATALLQTDSAGVKVEWVPAGQDADLRLAVKHAQLWLLPPDGNIVEAGKNKSLSFRLNKSTAELKTLLADSLQRVAKTLNLKRLAAQPIKGLVNDQVNIDLKLLRKGETSPQPFSREALPSLHAGDRLVLDLQNLSGRALDVTMLFIDSQYGIQAIYPDAGNTNRIEAGGRIDPQGLDINDETTGIESLVLLAVQAEPQKPVADFRFLTQPRLENTRGDGEFSDGLEDLLLQAGFGDRTRGGSVNKSPLGQSRIEVFTWRTEGK